MSLVIEDRTCFSGFCPCLYLRDHMKGRIDYCILEILKQISCVLFNTITMSDALAKVTEVLDFTEENIVDILSEIIKYWDSLQIMI